MKKRHGLEKVLDADRVEDVATRWAILKIENKFDPDSSVDNKLRYLVACSERPLAPPKDLLAVDQ